MRTFYPRMTSEIYTCYRVKSDRANRPGFCVVKKTYLTPYVPEGPDGESYYQRRVFGYRLQRQSGGDGFWRGWGNSLTRKVPRTSEVRGTLYSECIEITPRRKISQKSFAGQAENILFQQPLLAPIQQRSATLRIIGLKGQQGTQVLFSPYKGKCHSGRIFFDSNPGLALAVCT